MIRLSLVLLYAALAFSCWGSYGLLLHEGQELMGNNRWSPFICLGFAYFLVAVLIPTWLTRGGRETGRWTISGTLWSLLAGALGCLGSLALITAFNFGGKPIYVMPLVFGCAPVVNTLVTLMLTRATRPSVVFLLGIAMVALGAAGVLVFKPELRTQVVEPGTGTRILAADAAGETSTATGSTGKTGLRIHFLGTIAAIAATALCWGSYGPTLHKGQTRMEGSRLRPFICVGVSYFFLAILIPAFILTATGASGNWNVSGVIWSTLAGALGAVGALGIILAFNSGGTPVFVMPLVFGGAPVVNTLVTTAFHYYNHGEVGAIRPQFLFSLALVIAGAVTVLVFAPRKAVHPSRREVRMDVDPKAATPRGTPT